MKTFLVVLMALALASCIFTKLEPVQIEPVDLCRSSPQKLNNAVNCELQDTNNK